VGRRLIGLGDFAGRWYFLAVDFSLMSSRAAKKETRCCNGAASRNGACGAFAIKFNRNVSSGNYEL